MGLRKELVKLLGNHDVRRPFISVVDLDKLLIDTMLAKGNKPEKVEPIFKLTVVDNGAGAVVEVEVEVEFNGEELEIQHLIGAANTIDDVIATLNSVKNADKRRCNGCEGCEK